VRETEIAVRGAAPTSVRITTLAAADIHAHNTFDQPRAVQPKPQKVEVPRDGVIIHQLPPASVSRLTVALS
jgi:alpha-N-arabinofuranosidase